MEIAIYGDSNTVTQSTVGRLSGSYDPDEPSRGLNQVGILISGDAHNTTIVRSYILGCGGHGIFLKTSNNFVGYNSIGFPLGNGFNGILCQESHNTTIIGNTISCNLGYGMHIESGDNIMVLNNFIGLNSEGNSSPSSNQLGNARDGIFSRGTSLTIAGNVIGNNKGNGILFFSAVSVMRDNIIGLNSAGTEAAGNGGDGIQIYIGSDNTIVANNTVSGNAGYGMYLLSVGNELIGNTVGLDVKGQIPIGNGLHGIYFTTWQYGGSNKMFVSGNVVSGNNGSGMLIASNDCVVQGNIVGLDRTGKVAIGNREDGIKLEAVSINTTIVSNTISGNGRFGLNLVGRNHTVWDNIIGLDPGGGLARGNTLDGVISDGNGSVIKNNTVSGNGRHGVVLASGSVNRVFGNKVGLDKAGGTGIGNAQDGIRFEVGSDNSSIMENVVSGNRGNGVAVRSRYALVQSNIIGLDVTGSVAIGNIDYGITCAPSGGSARILANTISGNWRAGVQVMNAESLVQGNIIGLDVTGSKAVGNVHDGVVCDRGSSNTAISNNTISANGRAGVYLESANNSIFGNIIGLDMTGHKALGNLQDGILCFPESANTVISNNTVSGNACGIRLYSPNNRVQGNLIGLDVTGSTAAGNMHDGILCDLGSDHTVIVNNVVSGNRRTGVYLESLNNQVQGNIVGLDATGRKPVGNAQGGLACATGSGSTIIVNNTVSSNGFGLHLLSPNNRVQGNIIGLDLAGQTAAGNAHDGILCERGSDNATIVGNTIGGNGGYGVLLSSPGGWVQGNVIGLDLAGTAVIGNGQDGLACTADGNAVIVTNVISGNNGSGVRLQSPGSRVHGNIIGLDVTGGRPAANAQSGIACGTGSDGTIVTNNTISGNAAFGIELQSPHGWLQDNIVGLDVTGSMAVGNGLSGIRCAVDGENTSIVANTVSGNAGFGVLLASRNSRVQGSIVGLDAAGKRAMGNMQDGILCDSGSSSAVLSGNTIRGNLQAGVVVRSAGSQVFGNTIGLAAAGGAVMGNADSGIVCEPGSGFAVIADNTVSGNLGYGITVAGSNALVHGNVIGMRAAGHVAAGNAHGGVWGKVGSDNATIANNTISGNRGDSGVKLEGPGGRVRDNLVGVDITGATEVGNLGHGVWCRVGSDGASIERNTLRGNAGFGVFIESANTSALANSVFGNGAGQLSSASRVPAFRASNLARTMIEGTVGAASVLVEIFALEACRSGISQGRGVLHATIVVNASQFVRVDFGVGGATAAPPLPSWASALASTSTFLPWHETTSMTACIPIPNTSQERKKEQDERHDRSDGLGGRWRAKLLSF
jgi:parallel beta-helix repeat protein